MPSIGTIQLASPFCQAGLAGYSDRAMRLVARRRGCEYAVTEALLDVIMVNGGHGLKKSIDMNDEDHPLAGQLIGSEPETMVIAAGQLAAAGYDVIDLNYACPVKKIKNKARGGHMLRDVEKGIAILRAVRDAVPNHIPVTASLRRGFDDTAQSRDLFFTLVDAAWDAGLTAIRVHGRTVEQKYAGRADWSFLAELKRHYPDRTIIGSGDVFTAEDAVRMKRETNVDVVWIARGAIGNPWIFDHAIRLLADPNAVIQPPSVHSQRAALAEHFAEALKLHGEQVAGRRMRKMGIKYARFHPDAADVKRDFVLVSSLTDWARTLDEWYAADAPGVWPAADAADETKDTSCEVG